MNHYNKFTLKLFLILLLFSSNIYPQKKGIFIISDILNYFTTPISDDSLSFYRLNGFYETRLRKIINGAYFSYSIYSESPKLDLINRAVYVPYYTKTTKISFTPLTFKVITSPLSYSVSFYQNELDLNSIKLNFAIPPVPPNGTKLSNNLKLSYTELAVNYIPFSLFWGYLYPEAGLKINHLKTNYNNKNTYLVNIGINSSVMFKFKNLFLQAEYTKYFNNSAYIKDKLFIGGGIFLGWM